MDSSSSSDSVSSQVVAELINSSLSLTEDDNTRAITVFSENLEQLGILVIVLTKLKVLADPGICLQVRITDLDLDWQNIAE